MSTDFLRTIPHLRMRTAFHSLVNRTRSHLVSSASSFFSTAESPVYQVLPPLITSSDCEGAGEAFTISPQSHGQTPGTTAATNKEQQKLYFREPKYLTVSSQLHLEAHAAEQGDVFAFSPTFRAEESDTPRHLSEFYMLEAEYRQISFDNLMRRVRTLVQHLIRSLSDHRTGKELVEYYADQKHRSTDADFVDLEARWRKLENKWHTISYTSAVSALEEAYESTNGQLFVSRPQWGHGLQLEHERWIVANLANHDPVFVTHYPKSVKPFYMLPSSAMVPETAQDVDPSSETVACFDLLLPFGYCEAVGGSLREHRLEHLIQSMREKGLLKHADATIGSNGNGNGIGNGNGNGNDYPFLQSGESLGNLKWYADLRRFGSSPHGGYGLGFDRLVAYMTGVNNLREVVPFPRSWGRADC
jgi:asparaginyl-tRNA synthetase